MSERRHLGVLLRFDAQFCGTLEKFVELLQDPTKEYIESLFESELGITYDDNCSYEIIGGTKQEMQRFFGSMPTSEVAITKKFSDGLGLKFTIEAGTKGWTILFADASSEYKDIDRTAEANFEEAKSVARNYFPDMYEISEDYSSLIED